MDKKFIIAIVAFSSLILVTGLLIPGGGDPVEKMLPWQIEPAAGGSIRVFGLTLNQSTLREAESQLRAVAQITMFAAKDKPPVVEAYFDKVNLGGLSARMVMQIQVPQQQLQTTFQRGARISSLGSGERKVALSDEDMAQVRQLPISSIAYLPLVALRAELLQKRFGEPAQRLHEEGGAEHWLYPQLGLDVSLNSAGKAVLQYVAPVEFERLLQPLLAQSDQAG